MVDTEDPAWECEDEAETEQPGEGETAEVEDLNQPAEEEGLPADAALSLVSIDSDGAWGEDGDEEDEPWGLG